jgi:hypothetical protein
MGALLYLDSRLLLHGRAGATVLTQYLHWSDPSPHDRFDSNKQHGLLCDIAGALVVWKYGLPESISRTGAVHLELEQRDEAEKAVAKKYDSRAHFGIGLLMGGFVLQLISNFA